MSATAGRPIGFCVRVDEAHADMLAMLQSTAQAIMDGDVHGLVIARQHLEGGVIIEEGGSLETPPLAFALEQYALTLRIDDMAGDEDEDEDE